MSTMIRTENLGYTYPGQSQNCLKDISFTAPKGSIFGLLGPSGAGKSTTVKILTGILKGYTGKAEVGKRDLSAWKNTDYENIGVSLDTPSLYERLTAVENLRFFSSLYRKEPLDIMQLISRMELGDSADKMAGKFSKGMKVRLNLIRALVHDPEILFLDEPTSGLDPSLNVKVREMIRELKNRGRTILLTTHDMHVAEDLCDTVAFLCDGEIKAMDSPGSLKLKYGKPEVEVSWNSGSGIQTQSFPMEGLYSDKSFQSILKTNSLKTIHSKEASLDDIFIKITGRSLI